MWKIDTGALVQQSSPSHKTVIVTEQSLTTATHDAYESNAELTGHGAIGSDAASRTNSCDVPVNHDVSAPACLPATSGPMRALRCGGRGRALLSQQFMVGISHSPRPPFVMLIFCLYTGVFELMSFFLLLFSSLYKAIYIRFQWLDVFFPVFVASICCDRRWYYILWVLVLVLVYGAITI